MRKPYFSLQAKIKGHVIQKIVGQTHADDEETLGQRGILRIENESLLRSLVISVHKIKNILRKVVHCDEKGLIQQEKRNGWFHNE